MVDYFWLINRWVFFFFQPHPFPCSPDAAGHPLAGEGTVVCFDCKYRWWCNQLGHISQVWVELGKSNYQSAALSYLIIQHTSSQLRLTGIKWVCSFACARARVYVCVEITQRGEGWWWRERGGLSKSRLSCVISNHTSLRNVYSQCGSWNGAEREEKDKLF